MMGLVAFEFLAAAHTAELVIARIGITHAQLGFEIPVPAQNPGVTVGHARTDEPALVPIIGEFGQIAAQKRNVVFQSAGVILAAMLPESGPRNDHRTSSVPRVAKANVSIGDRAKASNR